MKFRFFSFENSGLHGKAGTWPENWSKTDQNSIHSLNSDFWHGFVDRGTFCTKIWILRMSRVFALLDTIFDECFEFSDLGSLKRCECIEILLRETIFFANVSNFRKSGSRKTRMYRILARASEFFDECLERLSFRMSAGHECLDFLLDRMIFAPHFVGVQKSETFVEFCY